MANAESIPPSPSEGFVILGVTRSGKKFRPSDWNCRLAGPYGKMVQNMVRYHPDVQPVSCNGQPGVRVTTTDATITGDLIAFAKANDLVVEQEHAHCIECACTLEESHGT
jgi:Protein of unknown function (DUF3579)